MDPTLVERETRCGPEEIDTHETPDEKRLTRDTVDLTLQERETQRDDAQAREADQRRVKANLCEFRCVRVSSVRANLQVAAVVFVQHRRVAHRLVEKALLRTVMASSSWLSLRNLFHHANSRWVFCRMEC